MVSPWASTVLRPPVRFQWSSYTTALVSAVMTSSVKVTPVGVGITEESS